MKIKVNDVVTLCLWVQNYEIFLESPKKSLLLPWLFHCSVPMGCAVGARGAHAKGAEVVGARGGLFGGAQRGVASAARAEAGSLRSMGCRVGAGKLSKDICYPEALGSEFAAGVAGGKFGQHFLCFAAFSKAQIGGGEVPACFCKVGSIVILRACRVEC